MSVDVSVNGTTCGVGSDAIELELSLVVLLPRSELKRSTILYAVGGNYPELIEWCTTVTVPGNACRHVNG